MWILHNSCWCSRDWMQQTLIMHVCSVMCIKMKGMHYKNNWKDWRVSFKNRWDVSKNHKQRTTASIHQHLVDGSMGCKNSPLLNFAISDIIIDELHLMLRVTDILLRNLIWAMIYMDMRNKGESNLNKIVNEIRSCGLTFKVNNNYTYNVINVPKLKLKVWKAKEGRSMESYDWTSLWGNDKKKVLKRLPPKIPPLLPSII